MTTNHLERPVETRAEKETHGDEENIARSVRSTDEDERSKELASASNGDADAAESGGELEEGELPVDEKKVDEPPNGGYGWVMVACCAMINAHTWGYNSSFGVFLAHYLANDVFPGATPLHYAFIGGLSISQALMVSPVATMTTRLYNTRTTLLIGVFFQTISLIGASFATKTWHLFLSQGVCFGWGMGFLFVGSVVITPQWFSTRRSLANGFAAAGSGLGGLIYSLATQAMIRNLSLAWTFRILGIVSCVVTFICSVLVKDRNKQIGSSQLSFDYRLFKKIEFLGLLVFGFLTMLGYIVLLFSLPSYARSVGMTAKQGSVIGAVLNLGQGLGRPPIGYFSDSVGRVNMATSMTFLSGLFALVIWMFAKSFGVLIFFALIGGSVAGTYWAVVGPVYTEIMGIVDLPSSLSITWLVLVLPTTFAEPIALELVAFNGNYTGAILFAGFMYVGAAGFLWLVRTWKIGDLERKAAVSGTGRANVDPLAGGVLDGQHGISRDVRVSSFMKRMFQWQRV